MAAIGGFVDEVVDRMRVLGPVVARRMFGGHGIFLDDRMFALITANELYLKADDQNRHLFEEAGQEMFSYRQPSGKIFSMSYYRAPEAFFEEREDAAFWSTTAWEAALRAPTKKKRSNRQK
jgi:DNA transformation protein